MTNSRVLHLAQDLEWLGCELEHYGHQHAVEGFPRSGASWDAFLEKQRGVVTTAEKIERELRNTVRYNPTTLVGVDYPLGATLESIALLLTALDDIKQSAVYSVPELPPKVRDFSRLVQDEFGE
jgi:hypothetical protein